MCVCKDINQKHEVKDTISVTSFENENVKQCSEILNVIAFLTHEVNT